MLYYDAKQMPEHLQEALAQQSGVARSVALKVAAVHETLRAEAIQELGLSSSQRILELEEESGAAMAAVADQIVDSLIEFLRDYSAQPFEEIEGAQQFEETFRAYARAQIGAKAQFAIIRALEIDTFGKAKLNERRFKVAVDLGSIRVTDEMTPAELIQQRARWVLGAIATSSLPEDLTIEEKELCAKLEKADLISEADLVRLEELLVRIQPNYALFNTELGFLKLNQIYFEKARQCAEDLLAHEERLGSDDRTFLYEFRERRDAEVGPEAVAKVLKIYAEVVSRPAIGLRAVP